MERTLKAVVLLAFVSTCVAQVGTASISVVTARVEGPPPVSSLINSWGASFKVQSQGLCSISNTVVPTQTAISDLVGLKTDIASTDATLNSTQRANNNYVHIPVALSGVQLLTNLPNMPANFQVNLNPQQIAGIFQSRIRKWAGVAENNPLLLDNSIKVQPIVYASSTVAAYALSDFLRVASADWRNTAPNAGAASTLPAWGSTVRIVPTEADVLSEIATTPGSIGFVLYGAGLSSPFQRVKVQNQAGIYLDANLPAFVSAASQLPALPQGPASWDSVSLAFLPGAGSYPITLFFYLIAQSDQSANGDRGCAAGAFLRFATLDPQQALLASSNLAPLPPNVLSSNYASFDTMTFKGCTPNDCLNPQFTVPPPPTVYIDNFVEPPPKVNVNFKFGNIVRSRCKTYDNVGCSS